MSAGADTKANTTVGGALERGHRASLEPLAQLGDAFRGVGAVAKHADAAELVVGQAATWEGGIQCQWALTRKRTLWAGGALELLEHAVFLDAARDDDGGRNAQPLAREVDLLSRLFALKLVDLKRVPVHTAKGRGMR